MPDDRAQDLLALDRDVARAWSVWSAWRSRLAADAEAAADEDPFEGLRHTAGKTTWDALRAQSPGATDAPLRDALLPWVGLLTLARIAQADDVAWARAALEAEGRYEGEPARRATWREAWRGVAAARSAAEASLWLVAASDVGPRLAAAARTRAARRLEAARRLGREHPWELLGAGTPAELRASARRWLDATDDLARHARRDMVGADGDAAAVLVAAVAREAGEGWPARLGPQWLEAQLGGALAGAQPRLGALPVTLGAASFARALRDFGFALHRAWKPSSVPFALASPPGFFAAHRLGAVVGALPCDAEWHARALGVGKRVADRQARALARTALLEVRLGAARLLLCDDADPAPRDLFDELTTRVLGAPVDGALRGAWPSPRDDEPSRWAAVLDAGALRTTLRERFDSDWFRNPRAWAHLRATAAGPATAPPDAEAMRQEGDRLARAFEGALG
jgi:hypothetical protein